ncbi:5574_t:CDS:2, partial [Scutellospora calospora]
SRFKTLEQNMTSNFDRYAFIGLGGMTPNGNKPSKVSFNKLFCPIDRTFFKTQAVKEAIEYANIIFTLLANDNAVNQTFNELLSESDLIDNSKKKKLYLLKQARLNQPQLALREKVENATNKILLYCPVLGLPEAAKNSQLSIIPSGNQDTINYMLLLLTTVLGKKVLPAG